MLLSDRVAIITGGARGIGRGIALKFAQEGCSVAIADVLIDEANKTVQDISDIGVGGLAVQCDVTDKGQVQSMVSKVIEKFGKVDILVNDAGAGPPTGSIVDIPEEQFDKTIAINLKSVFLCCQAVVPHMKEKGYGKIINISSLAAVYPAAPMCHYGAAKAGVLGLTYDVAVELASSNICVNAILPGIVNTDFMNTYIPRGPERDGLIAGLGEKMIPMKRVGKPEDIAGAALFLASELSAFVTGDRIYVSGGMPLPVPGV